MNVQPIGIVNSLAPGSTGSVGGAQQAIDGFGKALGDAVSALNSTQKEAETRSLQLAMGEQVDLHDVMITQNRANLSLELSVQIQTKLVEAYQEIMRMQV